MKMMCRTDLAVELREDIEKEEHLYGVHLLTKLNKENDIKETKIVIENEQGAKSMGKPIGSYVTIESEELRRSDDSFHEPMSRALHRNLVRLMGNSKKILVVGLGNREVTPDALGPLVVENLAITRHLIREGLMDANIEISAISPGVMAQTGMETQEILKGVVERLKPNLVIAIDALAARESGRLNKTIQISDTGITPGSGVGNHRMAINEETIGVKVIAIGVPTVISVPTIVNDAMDVMVNALGKAGANRVLDKFTQEERYQLASEMVEPYLADMFVTPKNIDEAVKRISFTISEAINKLNSANQDGTFAAAE